MLIIAVIIVGFSGLIVQVLLLREMLVGFYGNELTVGIILANWVILEAMGALLLGRFSDRINKRQLAFGIMTAGFIVSSVVCLYFARTFKVIFNIPSGLGLGIDSILWVSFLIVFPVAFLHGGLFSLCVKIYASSIEYIQSRAAAQVYFWETIGTILAGIIFTYYFIPAFDSFRVILIVVFINIIMLWFLYTSSSGLKRRCLFRKCGVAFIILLFFICIPVFDRLQESSIEIQWRNQEVIDYANSIYGNIVVTRQEEQYTFFLDGLPAITSPYPNTIFTQAFSWFPLLFHGHPSHILIISGGAGGLINEILRYPDLSRIDYVEIDPLILRMLKIYSTDLTERELSDSRVNVLNVDGRFFVKNTNLKYDVIFLGLSSPSDLQTNRLFTEEFFKETKKILNPGGIFTFTLPGSFTYLNRELKGLNACIINSLKRAYSHIRIIPGDSNIFLASDSPGITQIDSTSIIRRIKEKRLSPELLLPSYIEYRLDPERVEWFEDSLSNATVRGNRDFAGFALFKTLSLWSAQFSPGWQVLFLNLEKIGLSTIAVVFIIFFLLSLFLFRGHRRFNFAVPYAVVSTGFFGMLTNLIIIFSFQIIYGYLYYQIAMLITLFMAGAAAGSILISRHLERMANPLKIFIMLEIAIAAWSLIILFIILSYPLHFVFFILCIITGFWVGAEFPLANKIYLKKSNRLGETVGLIYAADLAGGWFAAILSGVFFLSVLGLPSTCMMISALKVISISLLSLIVISKIKYLKR